MAGWEIGGSFIRFGTGSMIRGTHYTSTSRCNLTSCGRRITLFRSIAATFTPKRPAARGTGQAETQRAAEHGSLAIYPTTPVALDHCGVFLRFLPLRFEAD